MVEKEVLRILKMRILVADKKIKEYKYELKVASDEKDAMFEEESWRWITRGMEDPSSWFENSFKDIEYSEIRLQWEEGKRWTDSSVKWLEQKYSSKVCDKFLSDKGVKVTNSDIEEFERVDGISDENGFVVYGDIMITDEEKDYLNLSPKFREYELLDVKSWNTEVEINAIKTRWELMGNAKTDGKSEEEILEEIKKENESRIIYDEEAGKVNLSNYRVTDIPTVTRVFPQDQQMEIRR